MADEAHFARSAHHALYTYRPDDSASIHVLSGLLPWCWPQITDWPRIFDSRPQGRLDAERRLLRLSGFYSMKARSYQEEAVRAALEAPLGRGCISVGCGGGKTRIAFLIAAVTECKWLYVVHGVDLIKQARQDFAEMGQEIEGWSSDRLEVMTWHSFTEYMHEYSASSGGSEYQGLIVDECHQAGALERSKALMAYRGLWRIGLSGTPHERLEGNDVVIGLLGDVVYEMGLKDLADEGYVSKGRVIVVDF